MTAFLHSSVRSLSWLPGLLRDPRLLALQARYRAERSRFPSFFLPSAVLCIFSSLREAQAFPLARSLRSLKPQRCRDTTIAKSTPHQKRKLRFAAVLTPRARESHRQLAQGSAFRENDRHVKGRCPRSILSGAEALVPI